jgi:hypothetical protein
MKKLWTLLFCLWAFLINAQSVSISSSAPSNTICSGTNVTFTANISGFTNPSYQWYANGTAISGATSSTYSSTSLSNGVQINVKVTDGYSEGAIVTNGLRFNLDAGKTASYPGTGTTWTDLSGNGNHGTLAGATQPVYSSDNGGSFVFNGSTSNVNLNKNASAIGIYDNSYTADAWVYPTDLSGDRGMFGDEVSANRQGLHLIFRGGTIHQGHYGSDANIGSVTTNSWWHIVFTFDKATGATKIYKNGVDQGNSGTIGSYIGTSNIHLGQAYGNSGYFQGKGAVYKMYDRVLSSAEVTTNYNALKNRFGATSVSSTSITTTVNSGPATPAITVTGDVCVNKTTLSTPAGQTSYAWYKDNAPITGAISNTYSPTTAGEYKVQVTSGTCSTMSAATTISVCGVTADGKMMSLAFPAPLVSTDGGANVGTGIDEQGKIHNTTGITTTKGTIGATTAIIGGVIGSTNGRSTSIGVVYSTDSNFGTSSTVTIQSNVAAGTYSTTLTGLTSVTTYFAKSFVVNKAGTSYGPVVSFTTSAPPAAVGDLFGGGIIYYILQPGDNGYDANVQHGLIAATTNQSNGVNWAKTTSVTGATGTAIGTGLANTNLIIANQGNSGSYAAKIARDYTGGGYTDWYLPSAEELHKMVGVTALNLSTYYHSSTEYNSTNAIYEGLTIGDFYRTPGTGSYPSGTTKTGNPLNVRAIRSF